jgi:hypothetical protein
MAELSDYHKGALGDALLIVDEDLFEGHVVPAPDSPDVIALVADIGAGAPLLIERRDDHLGVYHWAADGIRARIAADGGAIRHGWRLLEWPNVLLTALYHPVWEEPGGALVDITPAPFAGSVSLFAPDDREPGQTARHRILHVSPDRSLETAERVATLKGGQRTYEERRAAKAGQSLTDWIAVKHFTDPLIAALPAFIAACDAFTAKLARLPELVDHKPDDWNDAAEGEWKLEWETEPAIEKLIAWDDIREERMMDIEDGMRTLRLADTRLFIDEPEEP